MSNMATHLAAANSTRSRYSGVTIALHWLTALLVITNFVLAVTWGFLAKGTPLRLDLQWVHISLGILLAATIVVRIIWRLAHRHELPPATTGLQEVGAQAVHLLLYVLLCAQVSLGFALRWSQPEPFSFFGLFEMPHVPVDHAFTGTLAGLHEKVAWAIIIVAGIHAAAALIHRYVLNDRVLARMLPSKR